ncbi:MAG: UDP-3-O-(3-hydroxymyristoyl)glucosamine N-acyltransferase [Myxococcota bacterium]|nr:UDP-3-O-(3-hydroxymyristoyl)glucosamine N-acyltransferase [Myxococcota bacterium]
MSARSWKAGALAQALGGTLEGDPELELDGVAPLQSAGASELAFLANPRYHRHLADSSAGAVLLRPGVAFDGVIIRVADPYAAFARATALFHPPRWGAPGLDGRAAIDPSATLGEGCRVEAFAVIESGAVVGPECWIQAGAYVGAGARLGSRCRLMPNAVVMEDCVLGDRVWLNPGAVVGAEGFGFAPTARGLLKIPQVGRAVVESDVEIGANSCVDRAAMGETRVGQGSKLDNLVQVGHAATLGPHNVLVAYAGIAGSSTLGAGVTLAARSTVLGHINIADGTILAAHSMLTRSTEPGERLAGVPAHKHQSWLRASRASQRVHELERQLRQLQAQMDKLTPPEDG